jgi:quercetin dioxygenase-like cupin family protein
MKRTPAPQLPGNPTVTKRKCSGEAQVPSGYDSDQSFASEQVSTMRVRVRVVVLSVTALLAEILAGSSFPEASKGAGAAPAPAAITRQTLQTVDVPGSSYQVIEAQVEIPAHTHVPKHTHPGTVVGYVLSGDYSIQLDGQPAKSLAPGESFVVPSGMIHEEFAGAHAATVLAVFTVEKGKPLSSPAP